MLYSDNSKNFQIFSCTFPSFKMINIILTSHPLSIRIVKQNFIIIYSYFITKKVLSGFRKKKTKTILLRYTLHINILFWNKFQMYLPVSLFMEACLDSQRSSEAEKLCSFHLCQMYHQYLMGWSDKRDQSVAKWSFPVYIKHECEFSSHKCLQSYQIIPADRICWPQFRTVRRYRSWPRPVPHVLIHVNCPHWRG